MQAMDQMPHEGEETINILPVSHKSFLGYFTPTKKADVHEVPLSDASLVSPTPEKTEETVNNRCKKEPAELPEKQAMDQKVYEVEESANILPVAHKSCSESFTPTKKPHMHELPHFHANLVCSTPEKTEETKEPAELPEKYELLYELFDCMTTSLRLLKLQKQLPIFQNIRRAVETLTGRSFSYKNLAQIKFFLPEAVQTNKILLHNKKTLCMEPHIKVTLLFEVIEGHLEHSDYTALSRLISSRLFKFVNEHSEDYDVPEAELPEPFNRKEITVSANPLSMNSSVRILPNLDETVSEIAVSANPLSMNSSVRILPNLDETVSLNASHVPPSFKRHFSSKEFKTKFSQSPVPPSCIKEVGFNAWWDLVKQENDFQVASGNTLMKKPLVTNLINIETPDLSTPKRSVEDDKPKSMVNQKVTASSLFAKRSLNFSNFDEERASLDRNFTSSGPSAKYQQKGGSEISLKSSCNYKD